MGSKLKHWRFPVDKQKYTDSDGQLMVDRVLRYESLNEELAQVFAQLGVPFDGDLKIQAKSGWREDKRHYRDILTPDQAKRIRLAFQWEIDKFGYVY